MRIAMVSATPQSVRQGSGTYVAAATLRDALAALGHEVRRIEPAGLDARWGYTARRFRFNLRLRPAHIGDADIVVGWDMDGFALASRLRTPFVSYVHGILADEARYERGLVAASMRLQALAERWGVRRADRVITVSRHSRRRLAAVYGIAQSDIEVVPPPFSVDRWRAALAAVPSRSGPGPPLILCVARLYPRKDHGTLVRAARRLRASVPGLVVQIVGDGPERARLETLIRSLDAATCVRLTGQLDFADLVRAYATCDVFCLPSRQEGFGLVVLEAMAAGKPVVACRGTAVEELVEDGVHGALVPPGDHEAMAAALKRLLSAPHTRERMGKVNRARAAQYRPADIARRFVEALPASSLRHSTRGTT